MRSQRAVGPLLPLLKDADQDTQVECIQALGNIGDATAVRAIVKKAKGGFFSRPPREVRIKAFRALAGMGTPEAMRTLQEGTKDGDEGVRTVCKALIGVD
jgi:HEAT repeat protein